MKSKTFNTKCPFNPNSFLDVTLSGKTLDLWHNSGNYYDKQEGVFGGFAVDLTCKKSKKSTRQALLFALQLIEETEEEGE